MGAYLETHKQPDFQRVDAHHFLKTTRFLVADFAMWLPFPYSWFKKLFFNFKIETKFQNETKQNILFQFELKNNLILVFKNQTEVKYAT